MFRRTLCLFTTLALAACKDDLTTPQAALQTDASAAEGGAEPAGQTPGAVPTGKRFGFLGKTDATSAALTDAYVFTQRAPETDTEAQALGAKRASALAYFAAHRDECVTALLAELSQEGAQYDVDRFIAGAMLLRDLRGKAAMTYLKDVALRLPPARQLDEHGHDDLRDAHFAITSAAVQNLGGLAKHGDADARGALLALVDAGDDVTRAAAVGAFLRAEPRRYLAKRELEKHLAPKDLHLVNLAY